MSGVYWGIVAGLVALVATFFVCIELLYSNAKGSPTALGNTTNEPGEASTQASTSRRYAA
jgi:hypothetical protein